MTNFEQSFESPNADLESTESEFDMSLAINEESIARPIRLDHCKRYLFSKSSFDRFLEFGIQIVPNLR